MVVSLEFSSSSAVTIFSSRPKNRWVVGFHFKSLYVSTSLFLSTVHEQPLVTFLQNFHTKNLPLSAWLAEWPHFPEECWSQRWCGKEDFRPLPGVTSWCTTHSTTPGKRRKHGSLNGTHFGGIKPAANVCEFQGGSLITLHCLGWQYHDPR